MTESDLKNRATKASVGVVILAQHLTKTIVRRAQSCHVGVERYADQLSYELLAFLLHLADRVAYDALGHPSRSIYMNRLVVEVANTISAGRSPAEAQSITSHLFDLYSERQVEFGKFGRLVPGSGPLQGSLAWEFARLIMAVFGITDDELCFEFHLVLSAAIAEAPSTFYLYGTS